MKWQVQGNDVGLNRTKYSKLWAVERVISKMAPQGPHSEQSLQGVLVGLLGFDRIPLTPEMYSDKRDSDSPSLVIPT